MNKVPPGLENTVTYFQGGDALQLILRRNTGRDSTSSPKEAAHLHKPCDNVLSASAPADSRDGVGDKAGSFQAERECFLEWLV
ncbi:hypothetical protein EYF80_002298 [Liparis tanakae]|uniref:Uncharacterized protein n=1 Tax=Liparis tanakae TaxID=230148 RepID=A0A4Z2JC41_9TELE|nr:hypothetical protein EYF80_002298 [Liparis tanakae]